MSTIANVPARPGASPFSHSGQQTTVQLGQSRFRRILHGLPNLVVFSLLGGILYLGHHSGWKLPSLSALTGHTAVPIDDWCAEHLVPESECIECLPELYSKPKSFGFCRTHGVAECVIHHPELAQVKGQPTTPKYNTALAIGIVDRPTNNSRSTLHKSRVQFTSAESVSKSGIDVDVVRERAMSDSISANGELRYDPTRVAHLSVRVPGTVAFVFKTVGDVVRPGEVLALVDAALVGQAKGQLLRAAVQVQLKKQTADRIRAIATSGAIAQKSLIEAEGLLQEAEVSLITATQALTNLGFHIPANLVNLDRERLAAELRFLGIPQSAMESLPEGTATANLIPIRASFGGVIAEANIVIGEVVESTTSLFKITDPQKLWLLLDVPQAGARYVKTGLKVEFQTDDRSQAVTGQISWVSSSIDELTRTLKVRVVIDNADQKLRNNTFGTGRIVLREEPNAIVVPRAAVQSTSDAHFVFVRDKNYFDEAAPKLFYVRQVRIGASDDEFIELLAGVLPGEVVATKGSPVLLAQLQRSNLGAGCACHEH